MNMEDVNNLLKQLLNKAEWTEEEKQWLLHYLENTETNELKELMQQRLEEEKQKEGLPDPEISAKMLDRIHERTGFKKPVKKASVIRMWTMRVAAAASVTGLLVVAAYFWFKEDRKKEVAKTEVKHNTYKNDVLPGGDKALLTLANGAAIVLDEAKDGVLTRQGSTNISKLNGKLSYSSSSLSEQKEVLYNTVSTPRGGQYQIELPDGSNVWLNAASSLHLPTAFRGKERKVEITGEAYFEVAKNKAMPFIVKVNGAEVQVLGTHFNIMAYKDEEAVKTTLLEGSVKFVNGNNSNMLQPGQQSQLTKEGQVKVVSHVNMDEVMAWKNGYFHFEGAEIKTVMRQLSRWYDVEVVYNKKVNDLFYAEPPRNTKLSDVLKALELTGKVHFEIDRKKIIVMP
jgi:hypothetical protein